MRYKIDADTNYFTYNGQEQEEDAKKRTGDFDKKSVEIWDDEGRLFIKQDYSTVEIPRKILGNIIDVLNTIDDYIEYQEELNHQKSIHKDITELKIAVTEEPENEKG